MVLEIDCLLFLCAYVFFKLIMLKTPVLTVGVGVESLIERCEEQKIGVCGED